MIKFALIDKAGKRRHTKKMVPHLELITRIAVGAILGGMIGYERDIHHRPVGLRTHMIVSMASATFMVVSTYFIFFQNYEGVGHVEADVSRIAASVVSAIGFLAGGAILKTGFTIQGMTTAAGLWLVTAIGLCAGAGMYIESFAATLMGLLILTVLRLFEDKNDRLTRRNIRVTLKNNAAAMDSLIKDVETIGVKVNHFDYEKDMGNQTISLRFEAVFSSSIETSTLIHQLEKHNDVVQLHIEHPRG
jgi:putative Mg2+ transporter-C (MgtC) family protein